MFSRSKIKSSAHQLGILILILLLTSISSAASGEAKTGIQIHANYMRLNIETGDSVYRGEVKISRGDIEFYGEKVVVQHKKNQIHRINIKGQPARYIQNKNTKNKIIASSEQMQYFADKHRLVMTINARLEQPNHTIESQRIVYDTKKKVVIAGQNNTKQQDGRVNITLQPAKKTIPPANQENK